MKKIVLKGKKVILRPLSLKDAPRFCRWLKDREVTKFLSVYEQPPPGLKEEREWIKESKANKNFLPLAIDTLTGEHIGIVSLRGIRKPSHKAEFGIVIGDKKYWGQGYGTEACQLIVAYGFKVLKLHRIFLRHVAFNIRGHKSYAKVGFKEEGVLRDHVFRDGYYHDEIRMGLLKNEYLKNHKTKKYGRQATKN